MHTQHNLVVDTARKMGVSTETVFCKAAQIEKFSNWIEVGSFRFQRWLKHKEVPYFVEEFCLSQWRSKKTDCGLDTNKLQCICENQNRK